MARHRSPQGRRAHLGPPLLVAPAAAGVGGAARSIPLPQPSASLPVRFVATALAGGALAAAGQQVLAEVLPLAGEGATVLRVGIGELVTASEPATAAGSTAAAVVEPVGPLASVAPEPAVADASSLVKAAELENVAAQAAVEARAVEAARAAQVAEDVRAAETARVAEPERSAGPESAGRATAGGAVQMIDGRVTSGFGARWGSRHEGLDIAAPIGTAIRAPLGGRVVDSGPASGFGLWVRVEHADGTVTVYGHVNRSLVRVGEEVSAGEVIAEVGNRGRSTGPHLHLEVVSPGGRKIDPRSWLDGHGIRYT